MAAREQRIVRVPGVTGAALQTIQRAANETARELALRAPVDVAGDLTATSGYRRDIGPFAIANIAASLTQKSLDFAATSTVPNEWMARRSGSVTGISFHLSANATGSAISVMIGKNGSVVLKTESVAVGKRKLVKSYPRNTLKFLAEDLIQVLVTTDGSWTGTTLDAVAFLEVEL